MGGGGQEAGQPAKQTQVEGESASWQPPHAHPTPTPFAPTAHGCGTAIHQTGRPEHARPNAHARAFGCACKPQQPTPAFNSPLPPGRSPHGWRRCRKCCQRNGEGSVAPQALLQGATPGIQQRRVARGGGGEMWQLITMCPSCDASCEFVHVHGCKVHDGEMRTFGIEEFG